MSEEKFRSLEYCVSTSHPELYAEARRARQAEAELTREYETARAANDDLVRRHMTNRAEIAALKEEIRGMKAGEDWLQAECSRAKGALEEIAQEICDGPCADIARAALRGTESEGRVPQRGTDKP